MKNIRENIIIALLLILIVFIAFNRETLVSNKKELQHLSIQIDSLKLQKNGKD